MVHVSSENSPAYNLLYMSKREHGNLLLVCTQQSQVITLGFEYRYYNSTITLHKETFKHRKYINSRTSIIRTPMRHFNVKGVQISEFVWISELSDKIHYLVS